jgi:Spy/CpxP family protein refolding chaperone
MLDPNAALEKAKKLQSEISSLQAQLEQKQLEAQFEARKVLTPDQLKQMPPGCGLGIGPCDWCGGMRPGCGRGWGGGMGRMGGYGQPW